MTTLFQHMMARRARKRGQGKAENACDVKTCRRPATHKLRFRIFPRGAIVGVTPPMEGDMSLAVCDEHVAGVSADEFFRHDHNWQQVVQGFRRRKLAEPDRASVQVFPVRIQ